jgi:hypothetical protein
MTRITGYICTLFLLMLFPLAAAGADDPTAPGSYERFEPIPGPEDMDYDRWNNRIIVSSQDRRNTEMPGNLYGLDPENGIIGVLRRANEPPDFAFHPHGISIVQSDDGSLLLYVIVHGEETDEETSHSIAVYEVNTEGLTLLEILEDPLLESPNDLAAYPDGRLYVSNDSSKDGGMMEMLLGLKRSSVVFYDGNGSWKRVATRLAMANGVAVDGDTVYVAATRDNRVFSFTAEADGDLSDKKRIVKIKGPDNFYLDKDKLYVASHEKMFKLFAHFSNPEKHSPSRLYGIDLTTNRKELVFHDEGGLISAVSVGIPLGDSVYLGQIFDPFVLRITIR